MDNRHESFLRPFFGKLMASGCQWNVLHSADALPYCSKSDVDMVVSKDLFELVEGIIHAVASGAQWHVVQVLWYDAQYSIYYVLNHEETNTYLAVDILYDPEGLGTYGFETSVLLENPESNGVFNQTNSDVEFCYKLVKRVRKKYFTRDDKELLLGYYGSGNRNKIAALLYSQFGETPARKLLSCFDAGEFPKFTRVAFYQYNIHHYIKRKLLSLKFYKSSLWQARRLSNRIFRPCGIVVYMKAGCADEAMRIMIGLKVKMGLAFRSYTTASAANKLKIFNALVSSKLCICAECDNKAEKLEILRIQSHWSGRHIDYKTISTNAGDEVLGSDSIESTIETLAEHIEKILMKRVQDRLNTR